MGVMMKVMDLIGSPPLMSESSSADEEPSEAPKASKKGAQHSIGARIQALFRFETIHTLGGLLFEAIQKETGVSRAAVYALRSKAIEKGWKPGTPIEPHYVEDRLRSGRPKTSLAIIDLIIATLTRNSTLRGYSTAEIALKVSEKLPGSKTISPSTI